MRVIWAFVRAIPFSVGVFCARELVFGVRFYRFTAWPLRSFSVGRFGVFSIRHFAVFSIRHFAEQFSRRHFAVFSIRHFAVFLRSFDRWTPPPLPPPSPSLSSSGAVHFAVLAATVHNCDWFLLLLLPSLSPLEWKP